VPQTGLTFGWSGYIRRPISRRVERTAKRGSDTVAGQGPAESDTHQANWYVLVMGLPRPEAPLTLAPALTLVPLDSPLSVFDLGPPEPLAFANGRCWSRSRVYVRARSRRQRIRTLYQGMTR